MAREQPWFSGNRNDYPETMSGELPPAKFKLNRELHGFRHDAMLATGLCLRAFTAESVLGAKEWPEILGELCALTSLVNLKISGTALLLLYATM